MCDVRQRPDLSDSRRSSSKPSRPRPAKDTSRSSSTWYATSSSGRACRFLDRLDTELGHVDEALVEHFESLRRDRQRKQQRLTWRSLSSTASRCDAWRVPGPVRKGPRASGPLLRSAERGGRDVVVPSAVLVEVYRGGPDDARVDRVIAHPRRPCADRRYQRPAVAGARPPRRAGCTRVMVLPCLAPSHLLKARSPFRVSARPADNRLMPPCRYGGGRSQNTSDPAHDPPSSLRGARECRSDG